MAATVIAATALLPASATASNTVVTFAGTGVASSTGDGQQSPTATINAATGLAMLSDGTILIAEFGGNRIRAISSGGVTSTLMGTGTATSTGDGGTPAAATVNGPRDVVVVPGGTGSTYTYYVSELTGQRIRKVSVVAGTGTVSTIAGTGTAGFSGDQAWKESRMFQASGRMR